MIRLFIALKPWVLEKGYSPEESHEALRLANLRQLRLRKNKSLTGLKIAVTGFLARGTMEITFQIRTTTCFYYTIFTIISPRLRCDVHRLEVSRWLERLGAQVQTEVNKNTSLLIVGHHYKEEDRNKIIEANKYGIPYFSETKFRKRYSI